MSDYTLHHGDCLDILPTLEPQSVDAVICDIPSQRTRLTWDKMIPFEPMWQGIRRVLRPRGACVIMGCTQPFTAMVILSNLAMFRYEWIWSKSTKGGFFDAALRPMRAHESLLVFSCAGTSNGSIRVGDETMIYNPQGVIPCAPRPRPLVNASSMAFKTKKPEGMQTTTGYPSSVLSFANDVDTLHPTQKPLDLMEYLVKTYTNEGDTVLDFTMGSGTTGHACGNLQRSFIGIEKDQGYFTIAAERIATAYAPLRMMQVAV